VQGVFPGVGEGER
jgi:alpha-glucosidase